MSETVIDNDFLRQFELRINGELITIEYALQEKKIFLTKLCIPDELKSEQQLVDGFIKRVLDLLSERKIYVMPTNPRIAQYMKRHKKTYRHLLPVGINI
ncbi:MAG: N-acetyltransferase [Flavobacteriaceae bacterium]|nr:N-acetyltransferase [Flavobacteriaceae bacterium]